MRWLGVALLAVAACSSRVEVELHPEEGDKSIIIVIIEDDGQVRVLGRNLASAAQESLTQNLGPDARGVLLYYAQSLKALGLAEGELEQRPEIEFGFSLPTARHHAAFSVTGSEDLVEDFASDLVGSLSFAHAWCPAVEFLETVDEPAGYLALGQNTTINEQDGSFWIHRGWESPTELSLAAYTEILNRDGDGIWFRNKEDRGITKLELGPTFDEPMS